MKERLQIVLRKNRRSGDLIQIARKTEKEKICHSYQEANKPLVPEKFLNDMELFELEWFDQMVKFYLERTGKHATDLERFRLFLPQELYQTMYLLWLECKKNHIAYSPMDSMMKSIINKINATEKILTEKTGQQYDFLSKINYTEPSDENCRDEIDAQIIFSTLIELPDFLESFNQVASNKYHKSPTIKNIHFKGYAKAHHIPPKWVYACAIDVIAQKKNPLSLISEEALLILWIKPTIRAGYHINELEKYLRKWGASEKLIRKTYELTHAI